MRGDWGGVGGVVLWDELGRLRYGTGFAEARRWRSVVYKLDWGY